MKTFNYIFIILFASVFSEDLLGQIPLNVETNVMQPYPTQYSVWASESESFTVFVQNPSDTDFDFFLRVELMGTDYNNEEVYARISENFIPTNKFELTGGSSMLYTSSDISDIYSNLSTGDIEFSPNLPVDDINGELPSGEYRICIQAYEFTEAGAVEPVPLSPVNCSEYFTTGQASIELMSPDEFLPLNTDQINMFQWNISGIDFNEADQFEYQLDIYEIDSLQAAEESVYDLVSEGSAIPFFTSEPVSELVYVHDPTLGNFPMNSGNTYAAQVTVINSGGIYIENDSKSNIMVYGTQPEEEVVILSDSLLTENQADCFQNCHFTLDGNTSPLNNDAPESVEVGNFTMTEIEISSHNNDKYSGIGKIQIPWLNDVFIKTNFNNIKINSDGRMYEGKVNADVSTMPAIVSEAVNLLNTTRMIGGVLGANASIDLPIGIQQSIGGFNLTIAITDLEFTSTDCHVNTASNFHIPALGEDSWISMESTATCMHPGGFGNEFILHMGPDRPINSHGDILVNFKGSESDNPTTVKEDACYLEMDCNGVKAISIKADINFPENVFVPDSETGEPGEGTVKGSLEFTFDSTQNAEEDAYVIIGGEEDDELDGRLQFISRIDIDPFQLKGVKGWGFEIADMWFDASEIANVDGIVMPEGHDDLDEDGDLPNVWTGYYLEKGTIALPQEFLGSGGRLQFDINHGIIDPKLSMSISTQDLLPINEGNVDGWGISMDSVFMTINQNNLTNGGFSGQLRFPLADENQYLRYTAMIGESAPDEDEEEATDEGIAFTFNVAADSTLIFPFMISEVYLAEDSYIEGGYVSGGAGSYFSSFITGGINLDTKLFSTRDDYTGVEFQEFKIPFVDFGFNYHSSDGFSDAHFGLVDDGSELEDNEGELDFSGYGDEENKESLAGLPISIGEFAINNNETGGQVFRVEPVISLSPGQTGFSASAIVEIESNTVYTNYKELKLTGFSVKGISIDIERMGLEIYGDLEVYNDKDVSGVGSKGVKGALEITLPIGIGMAMAADFGSITTDSTATWNTAQNYPYWYFDGMISFGQNGGIPIAGPIGLYGIGGGIQYNMSRSIYSSDPDEKAEEVAAELELINVSSELADGNDVDVESLRRTTTTPAPAFGTYGLKMAATIATCPIPSAINMDVSVLAEFTSGDDMALTLLSIDGDAFLMTPLSERSDPKVWAGVSLTYSNPGPNEYAFDGQFIAYANLKILGISLLRGVGPGDLVGNVNLHASKLAGKNNWYLHIGNPDERCGLELGFEDILEVQAGGYFMLGHNLPTTLPVPEAVSWLFGETNSKGGNKLTSGTIDGEQNRSTTSINNAKSGSGIAFGAEVGIDVDVDKLGIYAKLAVALGFDINITKNEGLFCSNTGSEIGVNGWYGQGQIYGGLEGSLGFRVRALGKDHDLELFGLAAAMMLSGGGPNPFYADGRVGLQIRVLSGLIKCSKTISMEVGEKCVPAYGNPFGGIPIIAETFPSDGDKEVSHFAHPKVTFSLPMEEITEITIIKPNGNPGPYWVKPIYQNLKLKGPDGNEVEIDESKLIKGNKMLKIYPKESFLSKKWYTVELTIKAREYPNGPGGNSQLVRDGGDIWQLDTVFTFKIAKEVDLNEGISFTVPMRGQRYFLQDEVVPAVHKLNFTSEQSEVFLQDNESYEFDYFVRYLCEDGDEPIIIDLADPVSESSLDWDLPEFKNDKHYCMQLIRRKTAQGYLGLLQDVQLGNIMQNFEVVDGDNQVRSLDTLDLGEAINPVEDLGAGETALITYFFKTSKYNSLEEKMENATSSQNSFEPFSSILTLNTNENFDVFDTRGLKTEDATAGAAVDEGEVIVEPLIRLFDPMELEQRGYIMNSTYTKYYKDQIDPKLKLMIDRLVNKGVDIPGYPIPEREIDYSDAHPMHRKVVDYDGALDESVISKFGDSPYSDMVMNSTIANALSSYSNFTGANDVQIEFSTFDMANKDAKLLYLWGEDIIADPVALLIIETDPDDLGSISFFNVGSVVFGYKRFQANHADLYPNTNFGKWHDSGYTYYLEVFHGRFGARTIKQFKGYEPELIKFIH